MRLGGQPAPGTGVFRQNPRPGKPVRKRPRGEAAEPWTSSRLAASTNLAVSKGRQAHNMRQGIAMAKRNDNANTTATKETTMAKRPRTKRTGAQDVIARYNKRVAARAHARAEEAREKAIEQIAKDHLDVETLETRRSDQLDFHDISVWEIRKALTEAYEAGRKSTKA